MLIQYAASKMWLLSISVHVLQGVTNLKTTLAILKTNQEINQKLEDLEDSNDLEDNAGAEEVENFDHVETDVNNQCKREQFYQTETSILFMKIACTSLVGTF